MTGCMSDETTLYDEDGFPVCFAADAGKKTQDVEHNPIVEPIEDSTLQPITPRARKKKLNVLTVRKEARKNPEAKSGSGQGGCSKCRGSPTGCGRCRSSSFQGQRFRRSVDE